MCIIFTSLCKNFIKLTCVLHIIVQDQDGQNNNKKYINKKEREKHLPGYCQ